MKDKQIHNFLNGKLNDKEHASFVEDLTTNNELVKNVGNEIVKEYRRIKLKNKLQEIDKEVSKSRRTLATLIMAAVMLLALGLPLIINMLNGGVNEEKLFAQHFEPYKAVNSVRGNENQDELLSNGIMAYSANDYTKAIASLNQIENKTYVVSFYIGVSYLGLNPPKGKEAIASLNEVLASDNDFKQQATWYKALALLITKDTPQAKLLFEKIKASKGFNYEKATEILEGL